MSEAMTRREPTPDLYVLDAIADDAKDLETIVAVLNGDSILGWHRRWGRPFTRDEIVASVARMTKEDYVRAVVSTPDGKWLQELGERSLPSGDFSATWFAIRPRGRLVHTNWDPGDLSDMISGA